VKSLMTPTLDTGTYSVDSNGVYLQKERDKFEYSDGKQTENYLNRVLDAADDLSTHSQFLYDHIRDWTSNYHLSPKRSQVFGGFSFSRTLKVLELGCGCGAITRFLGENFDEVISVDGSYERAEIARKRSKDLESVSVICSNFQDLPFEGVFDLIVCVGVFEYSENYINGEKPFNKALQLFKTYLKPDGKLFLAIENQFGLKYFNGAKEDHVGIPYEGMEGYARRKRKVKTFGRKKLSAIVNQEFGHAELFYPFPDYKLPDCVVSDSFLKNNASSELIASHMYRDYSASDQFKFDPYLTVMEMSDDLSLPDMANSMIVVASNASFDKDDIFPYLGNVFSTDRKPAFRNVTVFEGDITTQNIRVKKNRLLTSQNACSGNVRNEPVDSDWVSELSLMSKIYKLWNADASLEEKIAPAKIWLETLKDIAIEKNGELYLPGNYIDAIWCNSFEKDGIVHFVDLEWIWKDEIKLSTVVIRTIVEFLYFRDLHLRRGDFLGNSGGQKIVEMVCDVLKFKVTKSDFSEYIDVQTKFSYEVSGANILDSKIRISMFLKNRLMLRCCIRLIRSTKTIKTKFMNKARLSWF